MRTETRTKTVNEKIYIANDGTEFKAISDCREYESKLQNNKRKKIDHKRIAELDNCIPYMEYANSDSHDYFWYNIETEDELKMLNEAYYFVSDCDAKLPAIICVETEALGYTDYNSDCYWSTLSNMIKDLNIFFKNVGYEIVKKGN